MGGIRDLERRYRGVWMAVLVGATFFVTELVVRVRLLSYGLRETLVSFEDNYPRWLVLTLVVVLGVVINKRNREAAITRQILETLNDEVASPLAMVYNQLEIIAIRTPGLRQEDLDKLARVQQAVIRIAAFVRELSEGKQGPPALVPSTGVAAPGVPGPA